MGGLDDIDAELRLLVAARAYIRQSGRQPHGRPIDELLDKRIIEAAFAHLVEHDAGTRSSLGG